MPIYFEQRKDYWVAQEHGGHRRALILRNSWTDRYLQLVAKYQIKIIRLNDRLGWRDSDISFLLDIPRIDGVDIISDQVTDLSPIFQMKDITSLSIYCKAAKRAGDFAKLVHLKRVGLDWKSIYDSIFNRNDFATIHISGFPGKDLTRWKRDEHLKELLLDSKSLETLLGIESFPCIRQLDLDCCPKLNSLNALAGATTIEELSISNSRGIQDLSAIAHLFRLKKLEIENCGDIESVVPVAKCKRLELLQIAGNTTVLDGDFSSLKQLPNLKKVLLAHRRHYTHRDEELENK